MAITIERCPHCGTPYMSALLPGEKPADRMCDNCNKRAGDPKNAAAAAPKPVVKAGPVDDDLMLQPVLDDAPAGVAAAAVTHKAPNARDQIVGQIQSKAGPMIPGLPADAPVYEGPKKPPLMTVASGIRLAILLVVLVVVANFVYGVYQRTFDAPITPTAPPPPTPTVAEMTKPPDKPAAPAKPAPPPAPVAVKPPEKKPDVPPAVVAPAKPAQLAADGGGADTVKTPSKPAADVNDLLSTDSRKKSRTNDDEDPDPAKPVVKAPTPPAQQPKPRTPPPGNKPPDGEQKDPMIAMLEKNKGAANQPPVSNDPHAPPGAGQPTPPNAPPGQQPPKQQPAAPPPNPGNMMLQGPITATIPQVIPPPPGAFSGVTFLRDYQGWVCKDYDDAHSLRESFFYNRSNVIMLTPAGRAPAKLLAFVEIPKSAAGNKPELVLEVTNKDAVHSWMLRGTIEGAEVLRPSEIKLADPKKPWQEIHIDLSNYADRRFLIQLEVLSPTANGALPLDHAGYIRNPHLNWKK